MIGEILFGILVGVAVCVIWRRIRPSVLPLIVLVINLPKIWEEEGV